VAANELLLRIEGATTEVPWSEEDNVFRKVRRRGLNSSLVGWYHPYCRILAKDVTDCAWFPYLPDPGQSLVQAAADQAVLLLETLPLAARFDLPDRLGLERLRNGRWPEWHAAQYRSIHARALAAARNPSLSLVFLHYPVPHMPYIYDRRMRQFSTDGAARYADNLALVDRTLGDLRSALESAGLWERTTLVLTSDHWHRGPHGRERGEQEPVVGRAYHRVPFLLRLPGQTNGVVFHEPVSNLLTHDLALAVLGGEIARPEEATRWLAAHRRATLH